MANTQIKLANKFMLGCDPEFAIVDKESRPVPPNITKISFRGTIGYDHGGRVYEFRPAANRSSYVIVREIKELTASPVLQPSQAYRWKSGGINSYPVNETDALGGHIHFGLSAQQELHSYDNNENNSQVHDWWRTPVLDALGRRLETLDILPRSESAHRRQVSSYGQPGDIRVAGAHLEYRSPASWLFKPETAFTVLTTYKLAVIDPEASLPILIRKANGSSWKRLRKFLEQFRHKDDDALRLLDLIDSKGLNCLQGDCTADFKTAWRAPISF